MIVAHEVSKEREESTDYVLVSELGTVPRDPNFQDNTSGRHSSKTVISRIRCGLRTAFLPEGFPESVSGDYVTYQIWDTCQALCSTLTGLLATRAILAGVGVGDATATAVSATLQWVARDLAGMGGRVLFASHWGSDLDRNCKSWRIAADVLNDTAMLLELLSPLFPSLFLVLLCAASLMKAVVGVAGGATRAALVMHQARRGNIADVSAKDGSQETAVNIVGLLAGVALLKTLSSAPHSHGLTWATFLALSVLHIYSNLRAVSAVVLETLNDQRTSIVASEIVDNGKLLSPAEVAAVEKLWWTGFASKKGRIEMGSRLSRILGCVKSPKEAMPRGGEMYSMAVCGKDGCDGIAVSLGRAMGPGSIIRSALHAHVARKLLLDGQVDPSLAVCRARDILSGTLGTTDAEVCDKLASAGWDTARVSVSSSDRRVEFTVAQ